jgi:hypothetical protein
MEIYLVYHYSCCVNPKKHFAYLASIALLARQVLALHPI